MIIETNCKNMTIKRFLHVSFLQRVLKFFLIILNHYLGKSCSSGLVCDFTSESFAATLRCRNNFGSAWGLKLNM